MNKDQLLIELEDLRNQNNFIGHKYLQSLMPIEIDDFKIKAKPFLKINKVIKKQIKKLKNDT